jgi:uncharacterized protein (TIGR03067 family)
MLRELVSIAFLCCPVPAMAADPAEEREKLEGAWTAISAERNGEEAAELVGHRLEFAGRRFHITAQGRILYVGSYAVEPEPQPAQIDFQHEEGEIAGGVWQGIYRLEDNTLTICDNAVDTSKPRPTEFATSPGLGYVLITFRRLDFTQTPMLSRGMSG